MDFFCAHVDLGREATTAHRAGRHAEEPGAARYAVKKTRLTTWNHMTGVVKESRARA